MYKIKSGFTSIVTKIFAQHIFVIIVLASFFISNNYFSLYLGLLEENENDVKNDLKTKYNQITTEIESLRKDTQTLAGLPIVEKILVDYESTKQLNSDDVNNANNNIKLLQDIFLSLIKQKNSYFQIRLISYSNIGQELVRVNKNLYDKSITVVSNSDLQQKGKRDYVLNSMNYTENKAYLSQIQLNRERGEVSQPPTPTLRSIVKINDKNNRPLGIVVINNSVSLLFQLLNNEAIDNADLYFWNQSGEFLIHRDNKKTFAFEYGRSFNIKQEFPQLTVDHLTNTSPSVFSQKIGKYFLATVPVNLAGTDQTNTYTLAIIKEYEKIVSPAFHVLVQYLTYLFLFLPILFFGIFYFSRKISRPIQLLNSTIQEFGNDDEKDFKVLEQVALDSHDESGLLAKSFIKLQQKLKESESLAKKNEIRLYNILSNMGDGVISINKEGIIVYVNTRAEQIFAYNSGELLGKSVSLLMTAEHAEKHDSYLTSYLNSGRSDILGMKRELKAKTKDGKTIVIDPIVTRAAVYGEEYFSAVIRDVTERVNNEELLKQYAEDLKRSNEDLNNFAYIASHDLKAPLRNIVQVSTWIEEEIDNKAAVLENLGLIKDKTSKMQKLLEDLLEYSRVGHGNIEFEEFNSKSILSNIFELLYFHQNFKLELIGEFPIMKEQKVLFEQVFRNLFDNAIKHHHKSMGNIVVRCRKEENYYIFSVQDDGPGIEPQYVKTIFEFLRRVNMKAEGSGLGLSLVEKIMNKLGGKIILESTVGVGSTFHIFWPNKNGVQELIDGMNQVEQSIN